MDWKGVVQKARGKRIRVVDLEEGKWAPVPREVGVGVLPQAVCWPRSHPEYLAF